MSTRCTTESHFATRQQIAESILGRVEWHREDAGYCPCPGASKHTRETGKRDCKVIISGAPTVFCFHQSCAAEVGRVNFELRSRIGKAMRGRDFSPRSQKAANLSTQPPNALAIRAACVAHQVFDMHRWSLAEIADESPIRPSANAADDWRLLLALFSANDVLWIGSVFQSGELFQNHFRLCSEWLTEKAATGQFICPNPIKQGEFSRNKKNIAALRFFIVESDILPKEKMTAVFHWLRGFLRLRAIVDTAGKSLHGWFEFPNADVLAELKIILPAFQCDRALFRPCQPVRLPGALRDGKMQKLLWLDLKKA
jgi:hypothetical protein